MSLLIDPLPESVRVGGREWAINSNFFIGVQFELLMQDPAVPPGERIDSALALYYPKIPEDLPAALDQLLWFYRCGVEPDTGAKPSGGVKRGYCFEQDAELIFSAFLQFYRIDLNEVEYLHWWKFRALFRGLPAECELCKIMMYRTADLKGLSKQEREFYVRMRGRYALKNSADPASALTLAQRNQKMKDYVARRFEEAKKQPEA